MAQSESDVLNDIQYNVINLRYLAVALMDYDERLGDDVRNFDVERTHINALAVANEASHQVEVVGALHMMLSDTLQKVDEQMAKAFKLHFDEREELEAKAK